MPILFLNFSMSLGIDFFLDYDKISLLHLCAGHNLQLRWIGFDKYKCSVYGYSADSSKNEIKLYRLNLFTKNGQLCKIFKFINENDSLLLFNYAAAVVTEDGCFLGIVQKHRNINDLMKFFIVSLETGIVVNIFCLVIPQDYGNALLGRLLNRRFSLKHSLIVGWIIHFEHDDCRKYYKIELNFDTKTGVLQYYTSINVNILRKYELLFQKQFHPCLIERLKKLNPSLWDKFIRTYDLNIWKRYVNCFLFTTYNNNSSTVPFHETQFTSQTNVQESDVENFVESLQRNNFNLFDFLYMQKLCGVCVLFHKFPYNNDTVDDNDEGSGTTCLHKSYFINIVNNPYRYSCETFNVCPPPLEHLAMRNVIENIDTKLKKTDEDLFNNISVTIPKKLIEKYVGPKWCFSPPEDQITVINV